jgi:glycosyltransferase involved in cell wall biosynthesis
VTPAVSVVVPTYRRAHLLPRLVAAFETQVNPPAFELIIVDNASPDDTATVLRHLQAKTTTTLEIRRVGHNRGPATARNVGWRAAQAPVVAFMDDDCVPASDWLREVVAAMAHRDLALGRTVPDPAQTRDLGPFSRTMSVSRDDGLYPTCNIAYRRFLLEQLDGFDESFEAGGEDTDLAWRAIAVGVQPTFAGDAVVHHDVRPSRWSTQLRDTTHWHSLPLAVAKHPQIRNRLYASVFWRRTHPSAIAVVAGLGLIAGGRTTRHRMSGLALMAPYVRDRLVTTPLPYTGRKDRLRLLPAALAIDLAEVMVLAAGSVKHRSLML